MNDEMDDKIEILISCLEKIHQNTDGSCPICKQPDYPVNGEKSGYDEVLPADAEEYHCDHTADCAVTAIEKFITAWNTHPLEQEIADLKQQLAENLKIWSDLNQENLNCEDENANLRKQLAEAQAKIKRLQSMTDLIEREDAKDAKDAKDDTIAALRGALERIAENGGDICEFKGLDECKQCTSISCPEHIATKALSDTSPASSKFLNDYWFVHCICREIVNSKRSCRQPEGEPCRETSNCITEYCVVCLAEYWMDKFANKSLPERKE